MSAIRPNISDPTRRSTGPKEPTPTAATRMPSRLKNSTTRPGVSGGVVVGMTSSSVRSRGPVPLAHTHFVPPASTPPNTAGSYAAGAQSGSRGSASVLIALSVCGSAEAYARSCVGRRLGSNSLSVFCWMDAARASPMMVASAVNDVNTSTPSQMRETVKLATGLDSMITAAFR